MLRHHLSSRTFWTEAVYLLLFVLVSWTAARFFAPFPGDLTFQSSARDVKQWAGELGDPSSYLVYAEEILKPGSLDTWHPSCFPPGMAVMNIIFYSLGFDARWMYWSQTLSILLWAIAFYVIFLTLRRAFRPGIAFLIVNSIWLLPDFRDWTMGIGTLYSESKTHPFFLMMFASFLYSARTRHLSAYALTGVLMAICIYLRVYFEKMALFFFFALIASELVALCREKKFHWKAFMPAIVFIAVVGSLLYPWMKRNSRAQRVAAFGMAPAQMHITIHHLWLKNEEVPAVLGRGENSACRTDPALCESLHLQHPDVIPDGVGKRAAILTFLKSPLTWYGHRTSQFNEFWVGIPWSKWGPTTRWKLLEGLLGYVLSISVILLSALGLLSRERRVREISWLALTFFVFNVVALTFAGLGIEGRHAAPIRLFAFFGFWWLIAIRKEIYGRLNWRA